MRSRLTIVSVVLLLSVLAAACTIRHGDFTVISNKLLRLSEFELEKADRVRGIEGRDIQHRILFIPTSGPPTLEGALDDILDKGQGDAVTDAVVQARMWDFILYAQYGWIVKGDVVKTRKY